MRLYVGFLTFLIALGDILNVLFNSGCGSVSCWASSLLFPSLHFVLSPMKIPNSEHTVILLILCFLTGINISCRTWLPTQVQTTQSFSKFQVSVFVNPVGATFCCISEKTDTN